MRRPIRTRRLRIAAIVSLAFVAIATAGIRSFWIFDSWTFPASAVVLIDGQVRYLQSRHRAQTTTSFSIEHRAAATEGKAEISFIWKFSVRKAGVGVATCIYIPLWPLLILLLIAPARWLIARPTNAPAFPAVTKHS